MIRALRLDEDLINSPSILGWCELLDADSIIVANGQMVKDGVSSMVQKMAVPRTIKVAIKDPAGALELLRDPSCNALKILAVVDKPGDLLFLLEGLQQNVHVHIGTYQRNNAENPEALQLTTGFRVTRDELKILRRILDSHDRTVFQQAASDTPVPLEDMLP